MTKAEIDAAEYDADDVRDNAPRAPLVEARADAIRLSTHVLALVAELRRARHADPVPAIAGLLGPTAVRTPGGKGWVRLHTSE